MSRLMIDPGGTAAYRTRAAEAERSQQWWHKRLGWIVLALAAILPFIVSPLPLLADYLTHIARFHIMNFGAGSPYLSRYYAFEWRWIGNMGVDLLMVPFGRLFGTETGARIVAAGIAGSTVWAIRALATAVHGRPTAAAMLSVVLFWSWSFAFGFINFALSFCLALFAAAAWIRRPDKGWATQTIFLMVGLLVWTAHLVGWAVLAIIIGWFELVRAMRDHRPAPALLRALIRAWPLAPPLLLILASLLDPTIESVPNATSNSVSLWSKLWLGLSIVRSADRLLDIGTAAALGAALCYLLARRWRALNPAILAAGATVGLCFLVLPPMALGSWYADMRLLAPAAMLILLSIADTEQWEDRIVAGAGLSLFVLRMIVIGLVWRSDSVGYAKDLALLDQVPSGARIFVAAPHGSCTRWRMTGREHLASLAVIRRDAFVNTIWNYQGYFLLRSRVTEEVPARLVDPVVAITSERGTACRGRTHDAVLAEMPRRLFDHVWFVGVPRPDHLPPWLTELARGPNSTMYRIAPDPPTRSGSAGR